MVIFLRISSWPRPFGGRITNKDDSPSASWRRRQHNGRRDNRGGGAAAPRRGARHAAEDGPPRRPPAVAARRGGAARSPSLRPRMILAQTCPTKRGGCDVAATATETSASGGLHVEIVERRTRTIGRPRGGVGAATGRPASERRRGRRGFSTLAAVTASGRGLNA